jgi:general stress protein 26
VGLDASGVGLHVCLQFADACPNSGAEVQGDDKVVATEQTIWRIWS